MTQPLITLKQRSAVSGPPQGFALWELGFRPFYFLASVFAALSIGLWALQYAGWLHLPYLSGPLWHAHEMVFGFTLAIVVGFLFTAGRNWSGRETPKGVSLALLAALWVAGRILVLTPYGWAAAIVNAAFPVASAIAVAVPFWAARSKRNYFFVGLLVLMGVLALAVHLVQLRVLALPPWLGVQIALDVILFIMVVMAGRVVPMFTNNGVTGTSARRVPWLERAALGLVLVVLTADLFGSSGVAMGALLMFAALAHLARLVLWQPWKTLRTPLVWVLHVAYLWIVVHLVLRALSMFDLIVPSLATHALTVGAIGGLTIGMMTRTARGHTGRLLKADGYDVVCYVLVLLACLVRVIGPLVVPAGQVHAVLTAASLWSMAFGLYAVHYWPMLSRPRLDGRPG